MSAWGPIVFLRDSKYGMPSIQSVHLVGLTVLLATVVVFDLRVAGLGMRDFPLWRIARELRPWTIGALTLSVLSGLVMFLGTPGKYVVSNPFRVKMITLCLAILFQVFALRGLSGKEPVARTRWMSVMAALVSLTLWFSVGWAGRAIAFIP